MATVLDKGFSLTQFRMLAILKDGKLHSRKELKACVPDELARLAAVSNHVSELRKKLPPTLQVDCVLFNNSIHYRLSRTISKADPVEVIRYPRHRTDE